MIGTGLNAAPKTAAGFGSGMKGAGIALLPGGRWPGACRATGAPSNGLALTKGGIMRGASKYIGGPGRRCGWCGGAAGAGAYWGTRDALASAAPMGRCMPAKRVQSCTLVSVRRMPKA
eukprot:scaffold2129_cov255-Pinguiococcus_pyrenoidosus.AAC.13